MVMELVQARAPGGILKYHGRAINKASRRNGTGLCVGDGRVGWAGRNTHGRLLRRAMIFDLLGIGRDQDQEQKHTE